MIDRCPEDPGATARDYLLGLLPADEAADFEAHYLGCPRCSEPLQFTGRFIAAYEKAAANSSR